ncbi:MAG: DUF5069 domain-containing protein [Nitrospirae bacterium]|nr:DUF5069 domain-containing protein [Nitrospirota bacterium]
MNALDLTREYPRSPKQQLGGYLHLGRMIDKARAKAAGTVGEYIYPCPLDQSLLEFLGISGDVFYTAVKNRADQEVLDWLAQNAKARSPKEIEEWNAALRNRKPQNEESMRHFLEIRNRVAPHRTDVTTWVDLLDLEEGRSERARG